MSPLLLSSCNSKLPGIRDGSDGQFYPNTTPALIQYHWSEELNKVGIWADRGPMTTTPFPEPTCTQGGYGIDPGLIAATTRVPVASMEDSRPKAILKFQPSNSFKYRVCYEPQLLMFMYLHCVVTCVGSTSNGINNILFTKCATKKLQVLCSIQLCLYLFVSRLQVKRWKAKSNYRFQDSIEFKKVSAFTHAFNLTKIANIQGKLSPPVVTLNPVMFTEQIWPLIVTSLIY